MEFISRFFDPPENSYFLFGPRGTGKSAWVRMNYGNELYIDFLQPDVIRRFLAKPERIRDLVHSQPDNTVIVVDEVQRAPECLSVIHSLIEEKRGWRFVLTGSSARKLKQEGIDLMAGRALIRAMHPFVAAELGEDFDLDAALKIGMLPLVLDADDPQEVLDSYIGIYIREEVKAEGLLRNLGSFSRFLEAISFSHAQVLNLSNVARECEVGRKTVEGYLSVLEDLLLCFRLPVFVKRAGRATVKHNKFYIFDTGVYRSVRPVGPLDRPEQMAGPALEGLVAQHVRAWIAYSGDRIGLYFWRTRGGSEVDFVIYGADIFCAIEVKHADKIHRVDLRGLKAFGDDYPEAKLLLLYRGSERLLIDEILCIPCEEFLRNLHPQTPFPAISNMTNSPHRGTP